MELSRWNVQEYELTDAEGETAVILYRPLTQGWRARHLEISLRLQRAAARVEAAAKGGDDGSPSEEQMEALIAAQGEASEVVLRFRQDLFSDLVVGCRNLTINDEEPSLEDLVEALLSIEELGDGLSDQMLRSGRISADEGKD